jgi:hypothetical protein
MDQQSPADAALGSRRSFLSAVALVAAAPALPRLLAPAATRAVTAQDITVAAGQTYVVQQTTRVRAVSIAPGGTLAAPAGYSLTMTVNGVETGSVLTATGGTDTTIAPGSYRGDIVLTVATANPVAWQALTFPFRQALYVGSAGLVPASSVLAAVAGGRVTSSGAQDIEIASTGEDFDGVYAAGGSYTLTRPRISLTGNGRCDFAGYGAAIVGTGSGTRLVVDGARIANRGVMRAGVIATGGSTVIVKNSSIQTWNGVLPAGYQATVDLTYMESAPWMLSISGNVRSTVLLGEQSTAAYISSSIASETWGVLSTDSGSDCQLIAINSAVANTGPDGYGSYAIGNATEWFLGCQFDVGTYATINRGGAVYYGDSTPAAVAQHNAALGLGLTAQEVAALPARPTVVNSRRFGFMWHGAGTLDISGGTVVNSAEATFLDKGQQIAITVDGSRGARLNPANGILMQIMENDDPGPVMVNGVLLNDGVYTDPAGAPTKLDSFDVSAVHSTDATASFTDIALRGDFLNAIRGGSTAMGSPGGLNMVLTFTRSRVSGVISATQAQHLVAVITAANYQQLGEVVNEAQPVINNGVIVTVGSGSVWSVTGPCYLSKLVIAADAIVTGAGQREVTMTVDGTATAITPGQSYTGAIVLTLS